MRPRSERRRAKCGFTGRKTTDLFSPSRARFVRRPPLIAFLEQQARASVPDTMIAAVWSATRNLAPEPVSTGSRFTASLRWIRNPIVVAAVALFGVLKCDFGDQHERVASEGRMVSVDPVRRLDKFGYVGTFILAGGSASSLRVTVLDAETEQPWPVSWSVRRNRRVRIPGRLPSPRPMVPSSFRGPSSGIFYCDHGAPGRIRQPRVRVGPGSNGMAPRTFRRSMSSGCPAVYASEAAFQDPREIRCRMPL